MVFCRGCGKEIHESAPHCGQCGATQKTSIANSDYHWSSITALIFGVIAVFGVLSESDGRWDSDTVLGGVIVGAIPIVLGGVSFAKKPTKGMWMGVTGFILGILVVLISLGST